MAVTAAQPDTTWEIRVQDLNVLFHSGHEGLRAWGGGGGGEMLKKKKKTTQPFSCCSEATSAAARGVKFNSPELRAQGRCGTEPPASGSGKIKQQPKMEGGGTPTREGQLAEKRYSALCNEESHPSHRNSL